MLHRIDCFFVCVDPMSELVRVPTEHTGSKIDQKILIKCGASDEERLDTKM